MSLMTGLLAFLPALAGATKRPDDDLAAAFLKARADLDQAKSEIEGLRGGQQTLAAQNIDLKIQIAQQTKEIEALLQANWSLRLHCDHLTAMYQGSGLAFQGQMQQRQLAGTHADRIIMDDPLADPPSPARPRQLTPQELAQAFYVPPGGVVPLSQHLLREICDCTPRGGRLGALRGSVGHGT
jgi:cell division protein FtsB